MIKRFAAVSAALMLALASVGCSSKSSSSSSSSSATSKKSSMFVSEELFEKDFGSVSEAQDGALLKISNTTAKPGGIAKVTLSVSNAEKKWTMCGLHIIYPDLLKCVLEDEENREPEYETGSALKSVQASVAREWQNNLTDDLKNAHMGSVFFTAICNDDSGRDGDIVTFSFRVPADAKPGTVYDFDYYYYSTDRTKDMFSNKAGDEGYDKFAFTHWQGGSVTVE
jgi:hypothetical protein